MPNCGTIMLKLAEQRECGVHVWVQIFCGALSVLCAPARWTMYNKCAGLPDILQDSVELPLGTPDPNDHQDAMWLCEKNCLPRLSSQGARRNLPSAHLRGAHGPQKTPTHLQYHHLLLGASMGPARGHGHLQRGNARQANPMSTGGLPRLKVQGHPQTAEDCPLSSPTASQSIGAPSCWNACKYSKAP